MMSVYTALQFRTPVYQSAVTMLVSGKMQKDLEVERDLGPGSLIETQMQLVMSKPIIERTVNALKLYEIPIDYERRFATRFNRILIDHNTKNINLSLEEMTPEEKRKLFYNKAVGELAGKIIVTPMGLTSMFTITVIDFDPALSGKIANVLSRSYVIFDLEQQIAELQLTYGEKNDTIRKLENYIEKLKETLDGRILPDIEAIGPASVKIVTQAGPGWKMPMRPDVNNSLVAAFILSIVAGVVLAFVFDFSDQTIKSQQEIERFLKIPYLGSIPQKKSRNKLLIQNANPFERYTQSFHKVSNQIYLSMKNKNLKSLLITDAEGAEETIVTIANLGICLSRNTGYRVLIIDADLRSPSIHKIFNISDTPGLTDVLGEKINFESAIQDLGSNLTVLPAGQTELDPSALLVSSNMSDVIKKAKELYELVFITCSDIKNYSDAIILLSCTDSIALIINEGKVRQQIIKNAIAPFEHRNVNIIGGVLNNHKHVIPEIIYRLT
jgi:capsular exopolysaccharide synthesis family protein